MKQNYTFFTEIVDLKESAERGPEILPQNFHSLPDVNSGKTMILSFGEAVQIKAFHFPHMTQIKVDLQVSSSGLAP